MANQFHTCMVVKLDLYFNNKYICPWKCLHVCIVYKIHNSEALDIPGDKSNERIIILFSLSLNGMKLLGMH